MEYTFLGRSGMRVSRMCLGTFNFGTVTDEKEAFRIMDAACDAGINFFDTANHYPDFVNCGTTESIIGRWLAQGGGRREKTIIATKVYQRMMDPLDGPNNNRGLSAYKIRRHVEGSLQRLQTDHIELYQMHHIDWRTSCDEIWEAFQILKQQGKIGYVGSSNFAGWHIAVAQAAAKEKGIMGLVSEQHKYSLMCRTAELEVLPSAQAHGVGILTYLPLAGGLLAGNVFSPDKGSRRAEQAGEIEAHKDKLIAFSELCKELGEKEANVAMAWLLAQPAVTSVITGPRTVAHIEGSADVPDIELEDDAVTRLKQIFPGPTGPAPEAYAW
jgi:aryl-alcohol dehydrogenase-like predicted oxidoreductase